MNNINKENRINRIFQPSKDEFKLRAYENEGKRFIKGYAAVYNQPSRQLVEWSDKHRGFVEFTEIIETGAFGSIEDIVNKYTQANINHRRDEVLGKYITKTLSLFVDEIGLGFEIEVNNTERANDAYENVRLGNYNENSFSFGIADGGEIWEEDSDGNLIHRVTKISDLWDVAIVTDMGAYPQTSSTVIERSLDTFLNSKDDEKDDQKVIVDYSNEYAELELQLINISIDK